MKRAVIYCRVSTEEQTRNLSLATQERECRQFCDRHALAVAMVFIDAGASAKTTDRPKFQDMISYCRNHADTVDHVVVYRLDRFARNAHDQTHVIQQLAGLGVLLRSVTDRIDETPSGKFIANMTGAVNQFDNDVRRERTIDGMKAAIEQGRWVFKTPLGYLRGVRDRGEPSLVHDPERAALVRRGFGLVAGGTNTQAEALELLTAQGLLGRRGKPVAPQQFAQILRRPVYGGRIVCETWGMDFPGDFEPLVDTATFSRVQRRLQGLTSRQRENPDFPLRRFVRCGRCSRPLTGSWSRGRGGRYAYYRCPGCRRPGVSARREKLEQQLLAELRTQRPDPSVLPLFHEIVLDVWSSGAVAVQAEEARLRASLQQAGERRRQLLDAFLRQVVDDASYQAHDAHLRAQEDKARGHLDALTEAEPDSDTVLSFATDVLHDLPGYWNRADLAGKRVLQEIVYPEGLTFDGEGLGTAASSPIFSYLREISACSKNTPRRKGSPNGI